MAAMEFDSCQQEIIDINSGHHLVLAPPGCGKTAILASRVDNALRSGVLPSDMLCLTFTNRASRGMQERITKVSGNMDSDLFIGNTHRFCGRYLFENQIVGMSTGILDENDSMSVILEIARSTELPDNMTFSQRQRIAGAFTLQHLIHQFRHHHPDPVLLNVDSTFIEPLRQLCGELHREATKSVIVDIYDNIDDLAQSVIESPFHAAVIDRLRLARSYEIYKHENGLIDFDDMLLLAYDALRRDRNHKRFSWVQIDEVQDLNPLQLAIADELTAPDGVTLYLGDEQQSIFSFIGARQATLNMLKQRCKGNIHRLEKNYRSPFYLLDVFNEYACKNFGISSDWLPRPHNDDKAGFGDLGVKYMADNEKCMIEAARLAIDLSSEGTTAIIVPANKDADAISDALGTVPHFKISGSDFFATDPMQFIISHLSVLASEHNALAWSKIMSIIGIVRRPDIARRTIMKMQSAGLTPSDFLLYDTGSEVTRFIEAYADNPIVIFDTETTGLNIFEDEIVQIAALKIIGGIIVDKFNIILETKRDLPPMLGDIVNPLVEVYHSSSHVDRKEGLTRFLEFAAGAVLIGHNIEFDYHILENNLISAGCVGSLDDLFPKRFDTLKLARIVYPRLYSYRLKDLLIALNLSGENSHLADDDIVATKSLADALYRTVNQEKFIRNHLAMIEASSDFRMRFKEVYGEVYTESRARLYENGNHNAMVDEISRMEQFMINRQLIDEPMKKLRYLMKFLQHRLPSGTESLIGQLDALLVDFATYREADLCEGDVVDDKIFVTTVHKAKGLEFDNVIIVGPVDGTYPFFKSETEEEIREDARKLYVAMTRARRRLILLPYNYYLAATAYGVKRFEKDLSPFLRPVLDKFDVIS